MNEATTERSDGTIGRHRRRVLSITDQLVWSSANAFTLVGGARILSVEEFGQLSAAVIIILIAISLSRAFVTEPMLLRVSEPSDLDHLGRDGRGPVLGAALVFAPVASMAAALLVFVIPAVTAEVAIALLVATAVTVVQDSARFVALSLGRPDFALTGDAVWLVVALGFLASTTLSTTGTTALVLAWWAAGAGAGLIAGMVCLRSWPNVVGGWFWIKQTQRVGRGLAADVLIGIGSANLSLLLVGLVAGSDELAGLRGAYLLLGPMNSLTEGVYIAAIPALAGQTVASQTIHSQVVRLSALLFVVWAIFAGLMLALPESLAVDILGDTWAVSRDIVPALLGASVIGAVAIGAYYGVRAWRGSGSLARIRLLLVPVYLVALPWAASVGGGQAYAAGLAVVAMAQTLLYWSTFLGLERRLSDRQQ